MGQRKCRVSSVLKRHRRAARVLASGAWLSSSLAFAACSTDPEAKQRPGNEAQAGSASGAAPVSSGGASVLPSSGASSGGTGGGGIKVEGTAAAPGMGNECGKASADVVLEKQPVDIILIVDNSGSMKEELASVEANINGSFAAILEKSGVDYRLIAISRHRSDTNTSLCVSAPLSALATCPAPAPGTSQRFFQFDTKVESDDSFDRILDAYMQPFGGPCLSQCDNGETAEDDGDDNSESTTLGFREWLRPGAKKVFLEMTDDNEDMPVATFVRELTRIAPEFGTPEKPSFIFHSIVGVAGKAVPSQPYLPQEPVATEVCENVTTAGETYQALSILTGGLRFPICEFANYDVVFNRIAEDVVVRSQIVCDFAIPPAPDGRALERDKIAVSYSRAGAPVADFGQAARPEDCQANAFYIQNDRVVLCPAACATVSMDPEASVDVLFTCESTLIVR